jgi:hypothetical protein
MWYAWSVLMVVVCACGCSDSSEGTPAAARKYLDAEFTKWISGQENDVTTMSSRTRGLAEPIRYDIRSFVPDKPDMFASKSVATLPGNWKTWPAYKANVAIEWKSQAGTPLTNVTTYTLTWNAVEKRWYTNERF